MAYEIAGTGVVQTRLVLPQFVLGDQVHPVTDGLVWPGAGGSLLRLECFRNAHQSFPDRMGVMKWFVQDLPKSADELINTFKISSSAGGDSTAYTARKALRIYQGWNCTATKGVPVLFPIQVVDLSTGLQSGGTLSVLLKKPLDLPVTNYERFDQSFTTFTPLLIGVTRLEVIGGNLRIFFKGDTDSAYVDFPLPKEYL